MQVNTVLGPVSTSELGYTLMHEHVMIADRAMRAAWPEWINLEEFYDYADRYIARGKRHGVRTIVDVTPFQLGRDASVIRNVAERAQINIIAATGFFWAPAIVLCDKSADFMTKMLVRDLEQGMEGTDVKAGVIKCGTCGDALTELDERIFTATVQAHQQTGAPILTHSSSKQGALAQMEFFDRFAGLDHSKIVIGHIGDHDDVDFLESVADAGYLIGEDRLGVDRRHPDQLASETRVENIIALWKRGKLDKIAMAHDASIYIDYWEGKKDLGCPWDMIREFDTEKLEFQFGFISEFVVPRLLAAGMTQADIDQLLIGTPRKFFEA